VSELIAKGKFAPLPAHYLAQPPPAVLPPLAYGITSPAVLPPDYDKPWCGALPRVNLQVNIGYLTTKGV